MRARRCILATTIAGALVMAASTSAAAAGAPPKLKVRLIEFQVQPARAYTTKGKTKIIVRNGGKEEHEFVVVRGDDPTALPTAADGSVDEDQIAKADAVGELEEIKKGKTKSKVFKLSPGKYIFFCNVVDEEEDGTIVSHFAEGMYTVIDAS